MTLMTKFLGAAAATALSAGAALAEPALIFDLGGKFDKSFNEAAFAGAQRWAEETGELCSERHRRPQWGFIISTMKILRCRKPPPGEQGLQCLQPGIRLRSEDVPGCALGPMRSCSL